MNVDGILHILWTSPLADLPDDGPILSFLPPKAEYELIRKTGDQMISGREYANRVRGEAVSQYLRISAEIGVAKSNGCTFRQALTVSGESSQWWYHPVSFKDCEQHPVLERMITLFVVTRVAADVGAKRLILQGAPEPIAEVLEQVFEIESIRPQATKSCLTLIVRGLLSRIHYLFSTSRLSRMARRLIPKPGDFDLLLVGFWGGSVSLDENGGLSDRYFKALPSLLEQGSLRVGWLVALEPGRDRLENERIAKDQRIVALPGFLRLADILRYCCSLGALRTYLSWRDRPEFRTAFVWGQFNLFALFRETLTHHFAGRAIPQCRSTALATERVVRAVRPQISFNYLEHHLFARSHYEGVRRSGIATKCLAMQHASVGHGKTFYHLHPELEFAGRPDGQPVPHPEKVFAMGELGARLFLEWGYRPDQIELTGVARFDGVRFDADAVDDQPVKRDPKAELRVLMVPSLADEIEINLIEAVCCAVEGLSGLGVCLRKHPFSALDQYPRFQSLADQITMTGGDLAADIARADVVLFTYSTVADEAFLLGKPCWQWLPLGFNGSALTEVVEVPQFGTVQDLRRAFEDFVAAPERFVPSIDERRTVAGELFGPADGGAARRMAASLVGLSREVGSFRNDTQTAERLCSGKIKH